MVVVAAADSSTSRAPYVRFQVLLDLLDLLPRGFFLVGDGGLSKFGIAGIGSSGVGKSGKSSMMTAIHENRFCHNPVHFKITGF